MLPIQIEGIRFLQDYEGLYFFIAILSAIIFFTYLCKNENIDLDIMYEVVFVGLISALIVGRLFSFLFWDQNGQIFKNPLIFFDFRQGGITVTGGVIGGLIGGFIYTLIKKLHFLFHVQLFIPAILLGQIIGRFGCFLNGDGAGKVTNMPWGLRFHESSIAYRYHNIPADARLHPSQLYEILGNLILFIIIMLTGDNKWISNRRFIWYALGYGIIRFITEIFRSDRETYSWAPFLSTGQLVCLAGIAIGIIVLIWSIFNDDKLIPREDKIARVKEEKNKIIEDKSGQGE